MQSTCILFYMPHTCCVHHTWPKDYYTWPNIIDHYLKIRPYIDNNVWGDLLPILILIPTLAEDARIRQLFAQLKNFESVSKGLQKADTTLFAARNGFYWLLSKHPHLSSKLWLEFCDHRWRAFENAGTKYDLHYLGGLQGLWKVKVSGVAADAS